VQSVAPNAVTATASRSYALQLNSAGQAMVNVPWTDTNSGGTVTSVATGTGLTGGTITTTGTLSIASDYTPNTASDLGASKNLDTYQTAGFYFQDSNADATSGSNYPVAQAGSFVVQKSAGVTQQYYTYNTSSAEMYYRAFYSSSWGAWRRVLTNVNYNSFSPTLTGTGASGTWGISVTGNAGTATTASGVSAGVVTGKMIYNSFTATASQTTFTTTNTYTSGKIEVYANGVKMVNGSDVTVTSGTSVVFAIGLGVDTVVDLVYPI
jgi:hypothetical protein